MIKIEEINGSEIIEFLNNLSDDDHEELLDVSCIPPYVFEKQEIIGDEFRLHFSAYYNNWGTDQIIEDNHLRIFKDGSVRLELEEPFEGDGSDDVLERILIKWLKKHKFKPIEDVKGEFEILIERAFEELKTQPYGDADKLQRTINTLIKAKTLIK